MNSRMDKYNQEKDKYVSSRTKRNEKLYQDINYDELEEVNLTSNAHVIGDNDKNINIDKIKEILESRYKDKPRKVNSLALSNLDEEQEKNDEITKEYNINTILEKAKLNKEVDYERDRLKKIRDTQYNILKDLDISEEKSKEHDEEELINLVNNINDKNDKKEVDPLDILTDLKGSDDTVVLEGINEEPKESFKEEVKKESEKTEVLTNSLTFTQSDFDDFNDLKEDVFSNKILVRILLVVVILALVIGIFVILNTVLKLDLF